MRVPGRGYDASVPLVALRNGLSIEAGTITAAAWLELKAGYRASGLTMACGQAGIPKTSSLGLQFFAHRPDADCQIHEGGPESPAHLSAESAVAQADRAADWTATIEHLADDRTWIADVMVER